MSTAARLEMASRTAPAGSSGAGRSTRASTGTSSSLRRARRRQRSTARCRAMVNTQARNARSSPEKRARPPTTRSQVSEVRSSPDPGAMAFR